MDKIIFTISIIKFFYFFLKFIYKIKIYHNPFIFFFFLYMLDYLLYSSIEYDPLTKIKYSTLLYIKYYVFIESKQKTFTLTSQLKYIFNPSFF